MHKHMNRFVISLAVGWLLVATRDTTAADRQGLMFGGSVGLGRFGYDDNSHWAVSTASATLDAHVGRMLNSRTAIVLDSWNHLALGREGMVMLETVGFQLWPTDRLWLKGGVGLGMLKPCYDCSLHRGVGALAAVGLKVRQSGRTAVDVSGRFGIGRTDEYDAVGISLAIGVSRYGRARPTVSRDRS